LATVKTQKKSSRGERYCGRVECGRLIATGETYYIFSFRYGGKHFRCKDHYPKRSELTQSRMSEVYAAIEDFEATSAAGFETVADVVSAVEEVANTSREVVDAYREAAEHFGGQGENAERADELEGWVDQLESFSPEELEEIEFNEEEHEDEVKEKSDAEGLAWSDAMQALRNQWEDEHSNDAQETLETAVSEANDLMNELTL
jgi:hypothetical protein